jgi:hypothetical protein
MQIVAKYFIVCVLAATIATISSRAADTDAQIKAREALRQKINELDAQTPVTNTAQPVATPSKPAKSKPAPEPEVTTPTPTPAPETVKTVPAPAPAPTHTVEAPPTRTPPPAQGQAPAPVVKTTRPPKPKPVAKTAPAPVPSGQVTASRPDSEKVAKARQAMEEKMRELDSQGGQPAASQPAVAIHETPPPTRPAVEASQPPPASTPAPVYRAPQISSTSQPSVSAETSEPLPTPPPINKSAQSEPKKSQKANKPRQTTPTPEPLPRYALPAGPPAPVSAEKVQKLDSLLQQYRADRITPEQYHQERAKILAGP